MRDMVFLMIAEEIPAIYHPSFYLHIMFLNKYIWILCFDLSLVELVPSLCGSPLMENWHVMCYEEKTKH